MATEPRAATDTPAAGRMPPGPPAHPLWGHARESGRDRLGFRLVLQLHFEVRTTFLGAADRRRGRIRTALTTAQLAKCNCRTRRHSPRAWGLCNDFSLTIRRGQASLRSQRRRWPRFSAGRFPRRHCALHGWELLPAGRRGAERSEAGVRVPIQHPPTHTTKPLSRIGRRVASRVPSGRTSRGAGRTGARGDLWRGGAFGLRTHCTASCRRWKQMRAQPRSRRAWWMSSRRS